MKNSVDIDTVMLALRDLDFTEIQLKLIESALIESSKNYNFIR